MIEEKELFETITWALNKITPIEQRFYSTGLYYLINDYLLIQKIALLGLSQNYVMQLKRQGFFLLTQQEEPTFEVDERRITEKIVWGIRELETLQKQFDAKGVSKLVEDFLAPQQNELMLLLQQSPPQVKAQLLKAQQQHKNGKSIEKENSRGAIQR